tara:strand:- start:3 stop:146 length:144 start_codon:yes stop_codon:yes gene_type:complete
LQEKKLFWKLNEESNSITIIVKHLNENMLSRWTGFIKGPLKENYKDD